MKIDKITPQQNFGYKKTMPKVDVSTPLGQYVQDVFSKPGVHANDQSKLLNAIKRKVLGARERLVSGALRYVVFKVDRAVGLEHPMAADLISEGNIALLEIVDKMARTKTNPKNVLPNISRAISFAVDDALPKDIEIKFPQYNWPGRLRGQDDIHFAEIRTSARTLRDIRKTPLGKPLSLSMPVGKHKTLADVITDDKTGNPFLAVQKSEAARALTSASDNLSPSQEDVLISHHIEGLTLDEIAARYDLVREAIRQKEKKGLKVLRHPAKGLSVYVEG